MSPFGVCCPVYIRHLVCRHPCGLSLTCIYSAVLCWVLETQLNTAFVLSSWSPWSSGGDRSVTRQWRRHRQRGQGWDLEAQGTVRAHKICPVQPVRDVREGFLEEGMSALRCEGRVGVSKRKGEEGVEMGGRYLAGWHMIIYRGDRVQTSVCVLPQWTHTRASTHTCGLPHH